MKKHSIYPINNTELPEVGLGLEFFEVWILVHPVVLGSKLVVHTDYVNKPHEQ